MSEANFMYLSSVWSGVELDDVWVWDSVRTAYD